MAALDPSKSATMERVAAFVIVSFTTMQGFITIAPYMGWVAMGSDAAILAQHQATIQNITISIISFLFGASVGTQKVQDAAKATAEAASAVAKNSAPATPDVVIPPGGQATVAAADEPSPK